MYKNSLKIYEIINYTRSFWLGCMISILFLKFIWLNDIDIWIFHFIMWILVFLFEVPTWSFADKYWYKKSINLAFFFLCLAFASFLLAMIFWKYIIFIFTALFFSLHSSFSSWAQNSYIYTIFKYEKKENEYIKFQTKITKNTKIIEWFAIIIWAYLYSYAEYIPYLIQFILIFWAFILSLFLKEEPIHRKKDSIKWKIWDSFKLFFWNKIFIYLLIFWLFTTIPHEYFHHVINQSIFIEEGVTVKQIGIIWVLSYIFSWLLVHSIPKILDKFWIYYSYLLTAILTPLVWISFLFNNWSLIGLIIITTLIYFINDAKNIIWDNFIQWKITNDKIRATTLSIFSMLSNLPTKFIFIIFWMIFVWFSYVEIMAILSWFFWVLAILFLVLFLSRKLEDK